MNALEGGTGLAVESPESTAMPEVLIVDDTPANLQLLATLLEQNGYKARPVTNGSMALRAAGSRPPDLVLLDINMPEMDGYEVCRRLKQDDELRDVPVLFISALSEAVDKVAAFRAGGVDFVTKPFDVDEVLARVQTHVRLRRAQVELHQKNQDLVESYRRLSELERLRDALAHMIAHDMRSPLTGIMGTLQFLRSDLGDAIPSDSLLDLEYGLQSVRRLVHMLNDMLDVSRLESGQMPVKLRQHSLREICQEAVNSLAGHSRGRVVDLSGVDASLVLVCDDGLLVRVLGNLLHNALKFSPSSEAVRVSVTRATQLRVLVEDRGPGIPQEMRGSIFDKFVQAELRQSGRETPASGLGLAFCKLAIEAHGGTIGVESTEGLGSTFWFEIPKTPS